MRVRPGWFRGGADVSEVHVVSLAPGGVENEFASDLVVHLGLVGSGMVGDGSESVPRPAIGSESRVVQ